MSLIPFDTTHYYFMDTAPHIDTDSHWLLLVIQSDLIRFNRGEQDLHRTAELGEINTRLSDALARFEPPKGAA